MRLELRSDRLRNERCNPALLLDPNSGCREGIQGAPAGYSLNDSRHLSQRNSQIFLLASFQLSLFAGDYR